MVAKAFTFQQTFYGNGYTVGGYSTSYQSSINCFNYANETYISGSSLTYTRQAPICVSAPTKGYAAGSITAVTGIDRLNFFTNTTVANSSALTTGRGTGAGVNSLVTGWFCTGYNTSVDFTSCEKMTFSTDTCTVGGATVRGRHYINDGISSSTNGYIFGGMEGVGTRVTYGDTVNMVNDTGATILSLPVAMSATACTNSLSKGYLMGGYKVSANVADQTALTFATTTLADISSTNATSKRSAAGHNSVHRGYSAGGYTTGRVGTMYGLIFANETSYAMSQSYTAKYDSGSMNWGAL